VLEQGTVDLLVETGVGDRLQRQGMIHHGIELRFEGRGHRIALTELSGGRSITIYGQQEVVKDLIRARLDSGQPLLFEAEAESLDGLESERPIVHFRVGGEEQELECDVVAGCDGFHGICRDSVPSGVLAEFSREYPFGWLGILAQVAPSSEELIYARHERGFALHSMRSPELTRLYLQCAPDEDLAEWPDERIWSELQERLANEDWTLGTGPIIEKGVTGMRSFVVEPMQYGRLYLTGDAAHIVPPTGAKGLNLAVADVRVLADGLARWYESGDSALLEGYSAECLRRVWRAEHFSWWMTSMLHISDDEDAFHARLQLAQLNYVVSSKAAATSLAENYVGLERV
jgi:p-hydroxybenzoate 3-monooxygenase